MQPHALRKRTNGSTLSSALVGLPDSLSQAGLLVTAFLVQLLSQVQARHEAHLHVHVTIAATAAAPSSSSILYVSILHQRYENRLSVLADCSAFTFVLTSRYCQHDSTLMSKSSCSYWHVSQSKSYDGRLLTALNGSVYYSHL